VDLLSAVLVFGILHDAIVALVVIVPGEGLLAGCSGCLSVLLLEVPQSCLVVQVAYEVEVVV
jgi:hypothetical protein